MEVWSGESLTAEAELELPRSAVPQMKNKVEILVLHTQVLRIRDEDSHLEEDLIAGTDKSNVVFGGDNTGRCRVNMVLVSKPILPSSPLSGKNSVKKGHAMKQT